MEVKTDENIVIKQVLKNNGTPAYVEWFAVSDSRNHILSAVHFCDTFGYSMKELKNFGKGKAV